MTSAFGTEIKGTRFTFEHSLVLRSGEHGLPYRSTQWWKTPQGALRAAERHAVALEPHYDMTRVNWHALTVYSDLGEFVTNEAA